MAWTLPESEFLGIDVAATPLEKGLQLLHDLQLRNLRLFQIDVTKIDQSWGQFDYIIVHGLYSWISQVVRVRLLKMCRELLAPQGIAFISYNVLPGCHLRNMLREMMLFHLRGIESPQERVQQAKAFMHFLVQAQDTKDEYRLWLRAELERLLDQPLGQIYHDDLARINEPLYFTQFMSEAASEGLQYLAEADYFEMSDHVFHDSVRETLARLGENQLLREQYLDFLKCRRFRQTLLCHSELSLRKAPQAEPITEFLVGSTAVALTEPANLSPGINSIFETPKGAKCQTDWEVGKAALSILGGLWPFPLHFDELVAQIHRRLEQSGIVPEPPGISRPKLCDFLLRLYAGGIVEFRTWLPPIAREAGVRPTVYPVARWQAAHGDSVASLFHIAVKIEDELGQRLLTWLDGTLERPTLMEKVWELLKSRNAIISSERSEAEARREMQVKLEENLQKLARLGLLVSQPAA